MSESDSELPETIWTNQLSPEDPWITDSGIVIDAFPAVVDVETSKEKDIEEMADPTKEGDVPSPSPPKSKTPKKTDEELWEDYLEKYDKLNKLKSKLDKKIKDGKDKFKKANPDASIEEKKADLQKRKKQQEKLMTEIKSLEDSIEKPTIVDMSSQLEAIRKEINLQKRIITEYKLDLLFDLDDEEVILNEFQTNKENLEKLLEYASELQEIYDKKTKMIEFQMINPDTGKILFGERNVAEFGIDIKSKKYVSRKVELDKKQKEFNQLVSDFKKDIKQYQQTGEISLLNDTLQKHKNIIIPLQNEIRNLKYQVIYMDKISQSNNGKINKKEMPIYHFHPRKVNIENETFYDI